MTRTPELARLEFMVGKWNLQTVALVRGDTLRGSGSATVEWGLGRTWLEEKVSTAVGNIPRIEGRGFTAWDSTSTQYVRVWIDGQSPRMHRGSMAWVDSLTLEQVDEPFVWSDGRTYQFKSRITRRGPDEINTEYWISIDGGKTYRWSSRQIRKRTVT
jgi:hypothetical protein